MTYAEHYTPKNTDHFELMMDVFNTCLNEDELKRIAMTFILDMDIDRQDIVVAMGRVEREKHWNGH